MTTLTGTGKKAGDHWAPALSGDGRYLALTSHDGRIKVYDTAEIDSEAKTAKTIANFETKGSFGMCVDIVRSRGGAAMWLS